MPSLALTDGGARILKLKPEVGSETAGALLPDSCA